MSSVPATIIESRAEYVAGSVMLILRWIVRWRATGSGITGWRWDDWWSISVFVWHTGLFAAVEYCAVMGAPLGFTREMREALSPEMRDQLGKGARTMYAAFFILIGFVWSAKAVLIAFFLQLTRQTKMYTYIWVTAGVSVASFLAACLATFTHCLPIERNWQILPDPGFECSAGRTQNITIAAGNVLVDLMLIVIPVTILRGVNMSIWRKVGIAFLLSLGVFVMAMTVVRCVFSLSKGPDLAKSSTWVFREALVTIFAVNAPVMTGLFRRQTWRSRRSRKSEATNQEGSAPPDTHLITFGSLGRKVPKVQGNITSNTMDFEMSSEESTTNLVADL